MKRETNLRIIFLALSCLLAVFFTVIYSLGVWMSFQLATVNILCIALITLNLAQAFTEKTNKWKVYDLLVLELSAGLPQHSMFSTISEVGVLPRAVVLLELVVD